SEVKVTRTVRCLPLRPTAEAKPTVTFLPLILTLPVFLKTCDTVLITELSSPPGWVRLSGTVKRSSDDAIPSIFTSKIGAARTPWTGIGQVGGAASTRIPIAPFFLVTPGPLLMFSNVSFAVHGIFCVRSDEA